MIIFTCAGSESTVASSLNLALQWEEIQLGPCFQSPSSLKNCIIVTSMCYNFEHIPGKILP